MKLKIGNKHITIKEAITFYDRLTGLMGKKNINYGILFKNCNSIHTFFMQEEIDVVALNQNNEIIFKVVALPKNKVFKVSKPQKNTTILELPKNSSITLNVGQKIKFENW